LLHPAGADDGKCCASCHRGTKQSGVRAWIASCFVPLSRNDGAAGKLYESLFPLSALLNCSVLFPMTGHVALPVFARYEAIQCTRMDCFTLRVRNDGACCASRLCEVRSNPCAYTGLLRTSQDDGCGNLNGVLSDFFWP
jgi:hypothetical protein